VIRSIATLAAMALLTACGPHKTAIVERAPSPPVAMSCEAECTRTCLPEQLPQWTADPNLPSAWDLLPKEVLIPLRAIAEACDAARASCVRCISRIERAGVVCGVTSDCTEASTDGQ
jgi:hypothetical protein